MEQKLNEVVLNGEKVTIEQLNEQIEKTKAVKGMKIVEVSAGIFKTRIQE